jgi:hypothetical protein
MSADKLVKKFYRKWDLKNYIKKIEEERFYGLNTISGQACVSFAN